uniref:HMA domain-containing protein n=1 Tax=Salix viminalis TaxID=40686 RepID=A0A6N2KCQ9_SALVM
MVETEVTTMVITAVDLGCEKCYKKIKKILCKIPQIQSQIFIEEKNTVTITVVCCSPEKIKRKILRKGCGFIECIVIKPPSPPPPPPVKPEVNVTIRSTCCNECNEGSCGPWCHCHSMPPPPCWVPCSCQRRGYVIIPRHAHSCKGAEKFRTPMIGVNVQHQPLDSNPVKFTTMVIKADLECDKCHKKIKKVLYRIPQIQNQIYDKKAGTVTITVFCCSPENVREKIIFKGGHAVKSIEIKVPPPPPPKEAPPPKEVAEKPKDPAKSKESEKPVVVIVEPPKPEKPIVVIVEQPKQKEPEPAPPPKALEPLAVCPPALAHPRTCSPEYNQWIGGGPCYHGHGRPASPSYEVHGSAVYDSWGGGGGGGQRTGYDPWQREYVYEDNPSYCTIM